MRRDRFDTKKINVCFLPKTAAGAEWESEHKAEAVSQDIKKNESDMISDRRSFPAEKNGTSAARGGRKGTQDLTLSLALSPVITPK